MKKILLVLLAAAILLSVGSVAAFAADEEEVATPVYSFLSGQQRSQSRNEVYAQAEALESPEEQEAFLAEQGVGEIPWSEETAADYSYVQGRQRGASYRTGGDDGQDVSGYSYVTGQQRGSSYGN